jgi:hypothetical protein
MARKSTKIARSPQQKRAADELLATIRLLGLGQPMLSRGVPLTTLRRTLVGRGTWKMIWATFGAACDAVDASGSEPSSLAELTKLRGMLRRLEDEHARMSRSSTSARTTESGPAYRLEISLAALRDMVTALARVDASQYIELRHPEFAIHVYRAERAGGTRVDYRLGYDVTSRALRV